MMASIRLLCIVLLLQQLSRLRFCQHLCSSLEVVRFGGRGM